MADVNGMKAYAGVWDDDTPVPALCLGAAVGWFRRAGVPVPAAPDDEYDLGVYMLATHYYDHRSAMTDGTDKCIPFGVMSIRNQLVNKPQAAAATSGGGA